MFATKDLNVKCEQGFSEFEEREVANVTYW